MLRFDIMLLRIPFTILLFAAYLMACDGANEQPPPVADTTNPTVQVEVFPFTHPTWSEDPTTITSLASTGELPVEWGPQGLPMAVLGVRVEPFLSFPVDISASVTLDKVVASVYYKEKLLQADGEVGHYFNLFMITSGYKEYVNIPGTLHVTISDPAGNVLGETNLEVIFVSP
jgi:hypothetical protein